MIHLQSSRISSVILMRYSFYICNKLLYNGKTKIEKKKYVLLSNQNAIELIYDRINWKNITFYINSILIFFFL